MAENRIQTIVVLRNDTKEAWEAQDSYVLVPGEVGIGYMTRTIGTGDDAVTKQVPIMKVGDGVNPWSELPQAEGVFEEDITLTYNFGRHTTSNGFVNAGGKGMTTSEWLIDALSQVKSPSVTYPTASMTASFTPSSGEAGTYITAYNWNGSSSKGSYQYGSNTNKAANSTANASVTWSVKLGDTVVGTSEDKTGVAYSSQITDDAVTLDLTATATCAPAAEGTYIPLNNVGGQDAGSRIKGFDKAGTTTKTITATASVTGYRKPFWGVKAAGSALDVTKLTSQQVRELGNSGSATKGLPTTTADAPFVVSTGTQQVFFLAKAGTYSELSATDAAAMNAGVTFTKVANAVKVEGANGYTAVDYDMWYVDWNAGIDADKKLVLTWK